MKKTAIGLFCLCFCAASIYMMIKKGDNHSVDGCAYSLSRQIRYSFTLQNKTNQKIETAEFWARAPVQQTATQRCERIQSTHAHRLIRDQFGNQVLHFTLAVFPPHAVKIIGVTADLMLSGTACTSAADQPRTYLRPERFIQADHPEVLKLARQLKAYRIAQSAENIFTWISGHMRYSGYVEKDRGALYALKHARGDCTEFMYLFAALCRANRIPARCLGGYICPQNSVVTAAGYHNWAEFLEDGAWKLADPQRKVFNQHASRYIATRIIVPASTTRITDFNIFKIRGPGLEASMNKWNG